MVVGIHHLQIGRATFDFFIQHGFHAIGHFHHIRAARGADIERYRRLAIQSGDAGGFGNVVFDIGHIAHADEAAIAIGHHNVGKAFRMLDFTGDADGDFIALLAHRARWVIAVGRGDGIVHIGNVHIQAAQLVWLHRHGDLALSATDDFHLTHAHHRLQAFFQGIVGPIRQFAQADFVSPHGNAEHGFVHRVEFRHHRRVDVTVECATHRPHFVAHVLHRLGGVHIQFKFGNHHR